MSAEKSLLLIKSAETPEKLSVLLFSRDRLSLERSIRDNLGDALTSVGNVISVSIISEPRRLTLGEFCLLTSLDDLILLCDPELSTIQDLRRPVHDLSMSLADGVLASLRGLVLCSSEACIADLTRGLEDTL